MARNSLLPILAFLAAGGWAGGAESPSLPPPPKKEGYSVFNPTPDGQLRDMDTDRPNVVNTPHTIDAGHGQLETGLVDAAFDGYWSSGENIRSENVAVGQCNLRLGILNDLELNAVVQSLETDRVEDRTTRTTARASGFGDTVVGGKLNLWGDDAGDGAGSTALAIQPQFKLPTGRGGVGNGKFEWTAAVPFLVNLPAGFNLGLQAGVSQLRDSANAAYVTGVPAAISVDRVMAGNVDIYAEYSSSATTERHRTAPQTFDFGGTYPLGKNLVFDAGVALGLNRASNDVELLAGVSLRR